MFQPDALKHNTPWLWSPGNGTDVWQLFVACAGGDLATVRRLVDRDPSLVRSHYEYRTPLSFAVRENHVDIAAFLLDHGAEPLNLGNVLEMARDRDYAEMTALLEERLARLHGASAAGEDVASAIRNRDAARVRQILDAAPELLHAGDARSNQPIHWAVMTRQIPVIDELLERGAKIDAPRTDGARPIQLTNGDYHYRGWRDVPDSVTTSPDEVRQHLIASGAFVDIGMAALIGDLGRVRTLLDSDPALANSLDAYRSGYAGAGAPLKNAAVGGHLAIVKLLLERGADPNLPEEGIAPHGHALYAAVYNGHDDIARLLLEHGAYPNPPVESSADAVWIAIRAGNLKMVELLAVHGATWEIPIDLDGALTYERIAATGIGRSISVLAHYGDAATAERLLAANPELANDPDALSQAARHEAFARLLLRYQPDLATRVTVTGPREMANLLFEHGMDPNRANWLGITPLHHFAENGRVEQAALFLDHGADLDRREDESKSTPLAWAARAGQIRMVEFLLRRGAKVTRPDDPAWATPRAWAFKRGHADIVALLDQHDRSGALPPPRLARYESLVGDLVAAYGPGDASALQRIVEYFRAERAIGWDRPPHDVRVARLRKGVRDRLSERPSAAPSDSSLPIDDARWLIGRAEGFSDWEDLERQIVS